MLNLEDLNKEYRVHIIQEPQGQGNKTKRWDVYISNGETFGSKGHNWVSVQDNSLDKALNKALFELKFKETIYIIENKLEKKGLKTFNFQFPQKQVIKKYAEKIINENISVDKIINDIVNEIKELKNG